MCFFLIALAFSHLQFVQPNPTSHTVTKGDCTQVSDQRFECTVPGDSLRFLVIGDIGGEERKHEDDTITYHNSGGLYAVAKGMDILARKPGMAPHFVLNVGDNFYDKGVTWANVDQRFKKVPRTGYTVFPRK